MRIGARNYSLLPTPSSLSSDIFCIHRRASKTSPIKQMTGDCDSNLANGNNRHSGARVSSVSYISSISSRGDGVNPNLLYPPLEEEGPPLFSQLLRN
jgi:hypothetical protein